MKLQTFPDYETLSQHTANHIAQALCNFPNLTLCMASGHTPKRSCQLLVQKIIQENINYDGLFFLGLDEWVGLPKDNPGSCHHFFQENIFKPLQLPKHQYHLFNGTAPDLQAECFRMDEVILQRGGVDLMLVGLGMNGHIGFNEPGTDFDSQSQVVRLDATTTSVGQKYFEETTPLEKGITIGLGQLFKTRCVILIANGEKKAQVVAQTVHGPVSTAFPASILQLHPESFVWVDEAATTLITQS